MQRLKVSRYVVSPNWAQSITDDMLRRSADYVPNSGTDRDVRLRQIGFSSLSGLAVLCTNAVFYPPGIEEFSTPTRSRLIDLSEGHGARLTTTGLLAAAYREMVQLQGGTDTWFSVEEFSILEFEGIEGSDNVWAIPQLAARQTLDRTVEMEFPITTTY